MSPKPVGVVLDPELISLLLLAGDEALLPAGTLLAEQSRANTRCFAIIEGAAWVTSPDEQTCQIGSGAFVGGLSPAGGPVPSSGMTVRLIERSRVLVLDPARLAELLDAEARLAAVWPAMTAWLSLDQA